MTFGINASYNTSFLVSRRRNVFSSFSSSNFQPNLETTFRIRESIYRLAKIHARACVSGSDNTSAIHDAVYRCPRMRRGIDESKCNFARCSAANLRELGLGCREYAYRIPIGTATAKGVLVHPRVLIQQTVSRGTYGIVFLLVQLDTRSRIPFHEINFTRDATQFRRL